MSKLHVKFINAILRYREFFYAIYHYREYLKQSVARDLRKRYKRSVLGYLWSMLNPLFMMIILTVVFSSIMKNTVEHYSVFLFSALLPWHYFSGTVMGSLDAIRGNMRIIDHVPIPKFIFSLSIAFSDLVNFFLSLVPLVLVMLVVGHPIPWTIILIPVILLPLFLVSMGIALVFSVGNVFFDDTKHLVDVIFKALFYLSPILYSADHLPKHLIKWLQLNPMFGIIELMREVIYFGNIPSLETYSISLGVALFTLAFGLWIFKRADDKFLYFV